MSYAIDRARRGAAVVGLVSALILLSLAAVHARNVSAVPEITLAQAATGPSHHAP